MSALNMSIANTNERTPALSLKSISAMRLDLIMDFGDYSRSTCNIESRRLFPYHTKALTDESKHIHGHPSS